MNVNKANTQCHRTTRRKKRAKKSKFKLVFTEHICTLKKLIPIIIYRLYPTRNMSIARKAEIAKQYIRNLLCNECKGKYINNWTNDFKIRLESFVTNVFLPLYMPLITLCGTKTPIGLSSFRNILD